MFDTVSIEGISLLLSVKHLRNEHTQRNAPLGDDREASLALRKRTGAAQGPLYPLQSPPVPGADPRCTPALHRRVHSVPSVCGSARPFEPHPGAACGCSSFPLLCGVPLYEHTPAQTRFPCQGPGRGSPVLTFRRWGRVASRWPRFCREHAGPSSCPIHTGC